MKRQTLEQLEKQIEERVKARQKRKTRKMILSGKSVFGLQKIIKRRSSNS